MKRLKRRTRLLVLSILVACMLGPWSQGQEPNPQQRRRRQFVEGLLQAFIESQLPPEREGSPSAAPSVSDNRRPAVRRDVRRDQPPASELREADSLLAAASAEMAALVDALQDDLFRAEGVRQLLSLAMKVNADAAVLARQLSRTDDPETLQGRLRELDQNWHTLAYRLSQIQNLSAKSLGHIERIRRYEQRLAALWNVPTQIDEQQVAQYATQLNASLRRLLEEIRFEISDVTTATRLLEAGRDGYEGSRRFAQQVQANRGYDVLRAEFESLEAEWRRYERLLRPIDNRFIQREVQRINDSVRALHGLLYIDAAPLQRDDLKYTVELLQQDTDQLLRRVDLKMLSELPAARELAVAAASDFDVACKDFADLLSAGDELDVLQELYIYVFDEWQRLKLSLQGISSQPARQSMRDIERSLSELQALLQVRFDLDRAQSTELAASLASLAKHVQDDIREVFSRPNRYQRDFQNASLRAAAEFQAAARNLHAALAAGEKLRQIKVHCDKMAAAWTSLEQQLPRFTLSDGQHLSTIRRTVTPNVVRMQTLLSL